MFHTNPEKKKKKREREREKERKEERTFRFEDAEAVKDELEDTLTLVEDFTDGEGRGGDVLALIPTPRKLTAA